MVIGMFFLLFFLIFSVSEFAENLTLRSFWQDFASVAPLDGRTMPTNPCMICWQTMCGHFELNTVPYWPLSEKLWCAKYTEGELVIVWQFLKICEKQSLSKHMLFGLTFDIKSQPIHTAPSKYSQSFYNSLGRVYFLFWGS